MATTFGWSYKSNLTGSKPGAVVSKVEKKKRPDSANDESSAPEKKKTKKGNIAARLYVGGLAWKTTEGELSYYFASFGDLHEVKIIKDQVTGFSRGFGFVTYTTVDAARDAKRWCDRNYPMVGGRQIHVDFAERRVDKVPEAKTGEEKPQEISNSTASPAVPLSTHCCHWQYKWTSQPGDAIYGPYSTSQMLEWKRQDFFSSSVVVREVDPEIYNRRLADKSSSAESTESTTDAGFVPLTDIDLSLFP